MLKSESFISDLTRPSAQSFTLFASVSSVQKCTGIVLLNSLEFFCEHKWQCRTFASFLETFYCNGNVMIIIIYCKVDTITLSSNVLVYLNRFSP